MSRSGVCLGASRSSSERLAVCGAFLLAPRVRTPGRNAAGHAVSGPFDSDDWLPVLNEQGRVTGDIVILTLTHIAGRQKHYLVTDAAAELHATTQSLDTPVTAELSFPKDLVRYLPIALQESDFTLCPVAAGRPVSAPLTVTNLCAPNGPATWIKGTRPAALMQRFMPRRSASPAWRSGPASESHLELQSAHSVVQL